MGQTCFWNKDDQRAHLRIVNVSPTSLCIAKTTSGHKRTMNTFQIGGCYIENQTQVVKKESHSPPFCRPTFRMRPSAGIAWSGDTTAPTNTTAAQQSNGATPGRWMSLFTSVMAESASGDYCRPSYTYCGSMHSLCCRRLGGFPVFLNSSACPWISYYWGYAWLMCHPLRSALQKQPEATSEQLTPFRLGGARLKTNHKWSINKHIPLPFAGQHYRCVPLRALPGLAVPRLRRTPPQRSIHCSLVA